MKATNGKDRGSVARKLRELAQILDGEYLPAIVNRRADDLKDDLAALCAECHDQGLADFLKSAAWTVGCMTVDGRARIIEKAMKAIRADAEANERLEPKASWQDLAQLPVLDRGFFGRTAGQLRHLASLLSEPKATLQGQRLESTQSSYSKAWFRERTDLSGSSITTMMKVADVAPAPRGAKNHKWTRAEAEKLLRYIMEHAQDKKVRDNARIALTEITTEIAT